MCTVIQRAILITLVALANASSASGSTITDQVRDGDIIFHTSRSSQSLAIQRATGSRYSHMGMILYRHGKPFVFEAVQTVRYTPLDQWVARGEGRHFVVKRLADATHVMTDSAVGRIKDQARVFEGKAYDLTFEWSDERIYCSELVWKIYDRALGIRIGQLQKLRSFRLDDPAVSSKLRERYGSSVPLEEPVISPGSMFDAPNLVDIGQK